MIALDHLLNAPVLEPLYLTWGNKERIFLLERLRFESSKMFLFRFCRISKMVTVSLLRQVKFKYLNWRMHFEQSTCVIIFLYARAHHTNLIMGSKVMLSPVCFVIWGPIKYLALKFLMITTWRIWSSLRKLPYLDHQVPSATNLRNQICVWSAVNRFDCSVFTIDSSPLGCWFFVIVALVVLFLPMAVICRKGKTCLCSVKENTLGISFLWVWVLMFALALDIKDKALPQAVIVMRNNILFMIRVEIVFQQA